MSQQCEGPNKVFAADGSVAIPQYTRVTVTAGVIAKAAATERGIGVTQQPVFADGTTQHIAVRMWNAPGTFKVIANGAVTLDADVYAAANGKVDDVVTTILLGKCLGAASGSGSVIEISPVRESPQPVVGLASGYKLARGNAAALDGSNPTPIATGLATIVSAGVQLRGTAAPGDATSVLTTDYTGSDGTLNVYAWKNTGGTDPTLVASTGTETFDWWAIGT